MAGRHTERAERLVDLGSLLETIADGTRLALALRAGLWGNESEME